MKQRRVLAGAGEFNEGLHCADWLGEGGVHLAGQSLPGAVRLRTGTEPKARAEGTAANGHEDGTGAPRRGGDQGVGGEGGEGQGGLPDGQQQHQDGV